MPLELLQILEIVRTHKAMVVVVMNYPIVEVKGVARDITPIYLN